MLCGEVEKLAVYVGERSTIKSADVESLTGHNRIFNAFSVIEQMMAGQSGTAVNCLRNMFISDKSAEHKVVGAFAFHFRRMFRAKALLDKGLDNHQVANKLGIWGQKDAFFKQVRRVSLEQIGSVLRELGRIDYLVKTGGADCKVAIEHMVMRLGQSLLGSVR